MPRSKILVSVGAGILIVGALGNLFGTQVIAEIRGVWGYAISTALSAASVRSKTPRSASMTETSAKYHTIVPNIPAGKKLFLQRAFLHAVLTDNQALMEARMTINPDLIGRSWFDMRFQAAGSQQGHYTGDVDLDVLINPGETIDVFLFRNDNLGSSGLNFARLALYGYLVDDNQ